jgi:GNAT superfamily N-acetyltransferase
MNSVSNQLEFSSLTGTEFEEAIYGANNAARLAAPSLKYYHPWPPFGPKVERWVFVATLPGEVPSVRVPIGMLELQSSPYAQDEVWLMYVSVTPAYQRLGISRRLLQELASHLRGKGKLLVRSRPAISSPPMFQAFIDQVLTEARIAWRQGDRCSGVI